MPGGLRFPALGGAGPVYRPARFDWKDALLSGPAWAGLLAVFAARRNALKACLTGTPGRCAIIGVFALSLGAGTNVDPAGAVDPGAVRGGALTASSRHASLSDTQGLGALAAQLLQLSTVSAAAASSGAPTDLLAPVDNAPPGLAGDTGLGRAVSTESAFASVSYARIAWLGLTETFNTDGLGGLGTQPKVSGADSGAGPASAAPSSSEAIAESAAANGAGHTGSAAADSEAPPTASVTPAALGSGLAGPSGEPSALIIAQSYLVGGPSRSPGAADRSGVVRLAGTPEFERLGTTARIRRLGSGGGGLSSAAAFSAAFSSAPTLGTFRAAVFSPPAGAADSGLAPVGAIPAGTLRNLPGVPGGVPEPAAWATMILGVLLAGSALRRRRAAAPWSHPGLDGIV